MAKPAFIKIGANDAPKYGVGSKATLLDRAAAAGLSVPFGVILLDEGIGALTAAGYVAFKNREYVIQDLPLLFSSLRLPNFERPVAVRPAFETGEAGSPVPAILDIDSHKPPLFGEAIRELWNAASRLPGRSRRDILIQEMIVPRLAGRAVTDPAFEDDAWFAPDALPTDVRALPKVKRFEKANPGAPIGRLQNLLRDIRRVFGDTGWDIEWADDGRACWLLRLSPMAATSPRNETFTAAELTELLPPLPSRLAADLAIATGKGLTDFLRGFDPDFPENRLLVEVFKGRPYLNLSLLTEALRRVGLPTRYATGPLGESAEPDVPFVAGRALRSVSVLKRLFRAQLGAVQNARARVADFEEVSRNAGNSFESCVSALKNIQTGLVSATALLDVFISGPVALLRRFEVLAEFIARRQREATRMQTDLEPIAALVRQNPEFVPMLRRGELPADRTFRDAWQRFLDSHGHRGVFECDIARPRYHEQPEPILDALLALPEPPKRSWLPSLKAMPLLPVWWPTSRAMRAREDLRDHAMRAIDQIREKMLRLAETAVIRGQLPDREKLWLLDLEELLKLDDRDWRPARKFFQEREAEQAELADFEFPRLIRRFDDIEGFRIERSDSLPPVGLDELALTDDSEPPIPDDSPFAISHPSFSSGRRAS
jgi:pyruvate,water dikinase